MCGLRVDIRGHDVSPLFGQAERDRAAPVTIAILSAKRSIAAHLSFMMMPYAAYPASLCWLKSSPICSSSSVTRKPIVASNTLRMIQESTPA